MNSMEKMIELHSKGYNCGQIIIALTAENGGWDESACSDLSDMCSSCGEICGTLRGGDYCINRYIRQKASIDNNVPYEELYDKLPDETYMEMMQEAKIMSRDLYDRFRDINGDVFCSNLRGDMMTTCAKYVNDVAEILGDLF